MRDIFSDLYNKVLGYFKAQEPVDPTKGIAKSRLKTVLMQDRVGFSERAMQMLKDELLVSISKYLEIDEESFNLEINPNEQGTTLNLSIPVLKTKTDDEIDEAIKEQETKTQVRAQEIVEELEELIKERAAELAGIEEEDTEEVQEEAGEAQEETEETEEIEQKEEEAEEAEKKALEEA